MQVLRSLDKLPLFSRPTALAIGNFDGLHIGHQKILNALIREARKSNLSSLVLTFSPHPEKVLGEKRIAMIQTMPQRLAGLREFGIQAVLIAPFDRQFAGLTKAEFVLNIIVSLLQAKEVVVGDNFRFGRSREGRIADLRRLGWRLGFRVHSIPAVVWKGRTVSSSLIRELLNQGQVDKACLLLGHPYEIEGRVVKGSSRGKGLGFPTANLRTQNEILPRGVFATLARVGQRVYPSVTNVGLRPTFGRGDLHIETHIFHLQKNLYRNKIGLRFLKRLREERAFPTTRALVGQIRRDLGAAQDFFKDHPNLT